MSGARIIEGLREAQEYARVDRLVTVAASLCEAPHIGKIVEGRKRMYREVRDAVIYVAREELNCSSESLCAYFKIAKRTLDLITKRAREDRKIATLVAILRARLARAVHGFGA